MHMKYIHILNNILVFRNMQNAVPCVWNNVKKCGEVEQFVAMDTIKQVMNYGKRICMRVFYRMSMSEDMSDDEREEVRKMMESQNMSESMMEDMEGMMTGSREEDSSKREGMMEEEDMDKMEKDNMEMEEMHEEMKKMFQNVDPVSEVQKRVKAFMAEGGRMEGNMDGVMKLLSVAPEDGYCVDPAKYKEFGRCDPAAAMECMMSIDRELLSPISTHDRLCL